MARRPRPTADAADLARADGWAGVSGALTENAAATGGAQFAARAVLTEVQLLALWRQNWIAREAVERMADDATSAWPTLTIDGLVEADVVAVWAYLDALNVKGGAPLLFASSMAWGRLYGGALLVLGIVDGGTLADPVNENTIAAIRWAKVIDSRWASVRELDNDPDSPTFGQPSMYTVRLTSGTVADVHASRALRFDGATLPDDIAEVNRGWHDSWLESRYDPIRDYGTGIRAAVKAIDKISLDVLKLKGLAQMLALPDGEDRLRVRLKALRDGFVMGNVAPIDADAEEYQILGRAIPGLPDLIDRLNRNVAGAIDVPESRLFGQQTGTTRTGAESDERSYEADVRKLRVRELQPALERLLHLAMIARDGPTRGKEPEWALDWPPLFEHDRETEAKADKLEAEAHAIAVQSGALDPLEFRSAYDGGRGGVVLDPEITASMQITAAEPPAPPALPVPPPARE